MTIRQAVQILGEPEEKMPIHSECFNHDAYFSDGDEAIRYGVYWLIPKFDGNQIECIVHQKGVNTIIGHICSCRHSINKYILDSQD